MQIARRRCGPTDRPPTTGLLPSPMTLPLFANGRVDPIADGRADSSNDGGADPGVIQSTRGISVGKPPTPVGGADPGAVAHAEPVAD